MSRRPLRVAFIVQGEGRGHLTQAQALAGFLRAAGHRVDDVYVGSDEVRPLPAYFERALGTRVRTFHAPFQVPDAQRRSLSPLRTSARFALTLPRLASSLKRLHAVLTDSAVDVVVNFFDLVGGLASLLPGTSVPVVAVAHNFLFGHRCVPGPAGGGAGAAALRLLTTAVRGRSRATLALSFDPLPAHADLQVVPPLLREGLDGLEPWDRGFVLAYALNPGYARDLAAWQAARRTVEVRCYVEGGRDAVASAAPGFRLHDLDDGAFLSDLAACHAYVGSAGFESVCEALYLGKPVLVVPTEGSFEQRFNASDAARVGAARAGSYADLDAFLDGARPPDAEHVRRFRAWVARAPQLAVEAVERAAAIYP